MRHTSDGIGVDHLALGILRRADQVVLVLQQTHPDAPPVWVLPGGLVESGELIVDGLIREVQEEAGAQVTTIARLACLSQIDRPDYAMQTVAFIFEVDVWHGTWQGHDPDAEIVGVELVPLAEAIVRLQANGGWPGIQEPMLAYLQGQIASGSIWFYREDAGGQHLIGRLPG
jgi:8-oxo-dGTP diphosphatase